MRSFEDIDFRQMFFRRQRQKDINIAKKREIYRRKSAEDKDRFNFREISTLELLLPTNALLTLPIFFFADLR